MQNERILIVDDTPSNIRILTNSLKKNYKISVATNGMDALDLVFSDKKPDLILLDIVMPEMDGYEVCERIKENDHTKEIPIIFVTAQQEIGPQLQGFESGGVDYITKPINLSVLHARISAHLALKNEKQLLLDNIKLREDVERMTRLDLKRPLGAILKTPGLLKKSDNLSKRQIALLDKLMAAGYKLLNMINMSLDLYKMEKGTYQVTPVSIDIISIIRDILQDTKNIIYIREINVEIRHNSMPIEKDTAFNIQGEALLVYSMLSNLIKNALEASPKNETITISLEDKPPTIKIHNQGAVPEAIRSSFFDKYTTHGKKSGNGLGTYSAKLIMKTLDGKISMDTGDMGTTLCVVF
jgi:CheY-like chemotaxis protein